MSHPALGKRILLGVTGSIAAYKAAEIASRLTQSGARVDVILSESACKFITPLTFQSVTGRKAFVDADLWGGEGHVTHVGLGHGADLFIIAPISANTLAKLAHGLGDNLLSLTALVTTCPLILAPAMDAGMYSHPATQASVEILRQRQAVFIGPAAGHLASGLVGLGRLVEPADILGAARHLLSRGGPLAGKYLLVTAGGTQEPIDPVRILTNRSSGKQGYAIAQAALDAGADVTLITTPTALTPPAGAQVVRVQTAAEMQAAVLEHARRADALVMAAAVADFHPVSASSQKIKKNSGLNHIPLEPTADILASLVQPRAQSGYPRRVIGFAAETHNLLENAASKLKAKNLDLIVANDVTAPDAGFETSTNRVTLLYPDGRQVPLPLQGKDQVADELITILTEWLT